MIARLQLMDLISEEQLVQLPQPQSDPWDEEALAAHVDEIIAEQQGQEEIQRKKKKAKTVAINRAKQSTSLANPSTVWYGDTPIVLREDIATPAYYTFCRWHKCGDRRCRKDLQINRPDRDTVVRDPAQ